MNESPKWYYGDEHFIAALYREGRYSIQELADMWGVSYTTMQRYLATNCFRNSKERRYVWRGSNVAD